MLVRVKGSDKVTRKIIRTAARWYAEKLMGKRLTAGLDININLKKNLLDKDGHEGTAIWEDDSIRPKEFTIMLDSTCAIRNILITLAHEMVHVKQWAKGEMYEYTTHGGRPLCTIISSYCRIYSIYVCGDYTIILQAIFFTINSTLNF